MIWAIFSKKTKWFFEITIAIINPRRIKLN